MDTPQLNALFQSHLNGVRHVGLSMLHQHNKEFILTDPRTVNQKDEQAVTQALNVARRLTYNEKREGEAKHVIRDLADRLARKTVHVRTVDGCLSLVTLMGQTRRMSSRERILYKLFGVIPPFYTS